ncbi:MAG: DUF2645 family protein [Leclercia sp.]
MKLNTTRIVEALSVVLYFLLACFFMEFLSLNKYDWMREPGDSVCTIPHQSFGHRQIQAIIAAVLLITPLLIAFIRDIILRNSWKALIYFLGMLAVTGYGWWIFFGRFIFCI